MKSLFILQLVCCVITAMLALQLAMASLQVRWKVWRYEISRWILVASMLFFSVHYLLQMIHGLRAQGADVGAAFNILFYTPVAFAITLSIINIESTGNKVRRYCLRGMMAYILIAIVFVIGMFKSQSLHIGNMLYVMLGLFVASMAYFILIIRKETKARKQKLMENFGIDLIPYVRYSQASIILLYFAAGLLPVAILFNTSPIAQDKITTKQLEDRIVNATALSRADVRSAITALAKIVREEMLSGRTVDLANLGSFKVVSNGKRVETEKAVTAETLKTPRIQFFPKLEMRNQAKNVQHVVIRESEAGSAKPSPNPGDLPEAPDSAL